VIRHQPGLRAYLRDPEQVSPAAHYRLVGRGQLRWRRDNLRDGSDVMVAGGSSVTALTVLRA